MTKPVQAYAAVSPSAEIWPATCSAHKPDCLRRVPRLEDQPVGWRTISVTIIPAEQYEAMVDYLERIIETDWHWAGGGKDEKIYGKHAKGARTILAALKEQDHG